MDIISFQAVATRIALIVCVTALIGCDGHTTMSGRVLDKDEAAIPEATVNLADGE